MPRREDRYSKNRENRSKRYDGYQYQDVDPEYDARTYTADSHHNHSTAPVALSGSSTNSRQSKPSLVNYEYGSDDSPVVNSGSHRKKEKRRSRSRSRSESIASSKRDKKDSKKSKKKKKSRSNSRERDSSVSKKNKATKRHADSITRSPTAVPKAQSPDIIEVEQPPPPKRRASPPRQYAANSSPPATKAHPASPPRAYQSGRGSRKESETEVRSRRSRDRSPLHRERRSSKSPTSPYG